MKKALSSEFNQGKSTQHLCFDQKEKQKGGEKCKHTGSSQEEGVRARV